MQCGGSFGSARKDWDQGPPASHFGRVAFVFALWACCSLHPITRSSLTHSLPTPHQPQHQRLLGTPTANGTDFVTSSVSFVTFVFALGFAVALANC